MERRIITTDVIEEDLKTEGNLRPQLLVDYIGQEKAKENLKVYIEAAKQRGDGVLHALQGVADDDDDCHRRNERNAHAQV